MPPNLYHNLAMALLRIGRYPNAFVDTQRMTMTCTSVARLSHNNIQTYRSEIEYSCHHIKGNNCQGQDEWRQWGWDNCTFATASRGEVFEMSGWMYRQNHSKLESVNGYGEDSHNLQPFDYFNRKKKIGAHWKAVGWLPMPHKVEKGTWEEFEWDTFEEKLQKAVQSNVVYVEHLGYGVSNMIFNNSNEEGV